MDDGITVTLDGVLGLAVLIAFLVVVGLIAGRILGVRRGFWRATLAGLVGFFAGQWLINMQYENSTEADFNDLGDLGRLGVGFVGYVLLVTMLASIVIDVIARPRGGDRRRRWPRPIKAVRRRWQVVTRLRQIVGAARRHGFAGRRYASRAALATPEGARALRATLEDCGGMFVKFGQIASTREDLLPATVTEELGHLRTAAPGLPAAVVTEIVEQQTGRPAAATFATFAAEPLAAASIGVTYRATLAGGRRVIVKIRRPDIEDIVDRDARVLRWGAAQLERRSEGARSLGIRDLADELVSGIAAELDFRTEAANNAAMRRAVPGGHGVEVPLVHADLTTRSMLVMDEVDGRPVSDPAALRASGIARPVLADRLFRAFLEQVLTAGVFHADPHPGNVLVDAEGTLWFIDFGAVGQLDPVTLDGLQQLALGFMLADPSMLARALRRLAGPDGDALDMRAMEFELSSVLTRVQGGGFDPAVLQLVVHVLARHGVKAPRALTVLGRAMLTLDGTLRIIDPGFRMVERATETIRELPEAGVGSLKERLTHEAMRALPAVRSMPQLVEDIALQTRSGRLGIRVGLFGGEDRLVLDDWIDRVLFAVVGMVGLLSSAALLVAAGVEDNADVAVVLRAAGFTGLVAATAMQMRSVAQILRRPRTNRRP
ncbi:MAG: AarF/ABC1/UbiB kinase family protein [Actinomycetota bacterium]|nr:MAG: AarF/ABC1/UbiB kinase family protein [Actinomycetota bacterium]